MLVQYGIKTSPGVVLWLLFWMMVLSTLIQIFEIIMKQRLAGTLTIMIVIQCLVIAETTLTNTARGRLMYNPIFTVAETCDGPASHSWDQRSFGTVNCTEASS